MPCLSRHSHLICVSHSVRSSLLMISQCSAKCGSGVQTRKVFCGTFSDDTVKKVPDDNCDLEKKFEDSQNCTAEEVCKGEWFAGPWSKVCIFRYDGSKCWYCLPSTFVNNFFCWWLPLNPLLYTFPLKVWASIHVLNNYRIYFSIITALINGISSKCN